MLDDTWSVAVRAAAVLCAATALAGTARAGDVQELREGWAVQSSAKAAQDGATLSAPGFKAEGWYKTVVPRTVLAALVDNKVYPDPFFGKNLRSIPGTSYPIGQNFSNLPMPEDSPFRVSWWYRTEFQGPALPKDGAAWLRFEGINYRANVWLNGQRVADAKDMAGTFRRFELDVTRAFRPGAVNALAVEVFAPQPTDLANTFVDWNPAPPDKEMGIWQPVSLRTSGPVAVRHPHVITDLEVPSLAAAHLTVTARLHNSLDRPVSATLQGRIESIQFEQTVALGPKEEKEVAFTPSTAPGLNIDHPRVWWPHTMGAQNLYRLDLAAEVEGAVSDRESTSFGIEKVTSEKNEKGGCLFRVNGRKVLIRGGGWTPDMMLRYSPERIEAELRYVKDMNLNTVRLEGKFENDVFYDLADRMGILVMAGWCCCDHWEKWPKWKGDERKIASASLVDQIRRLRNHPSVFVWLNGSDNPPPADVESMYLDLLKELQWPRPTLSSATEQKTKVTGESGVKMRGPYDYVPPSYWLEDTQHGGAVGFDTEVGPGPAVPPVESLKRMMPAQSLWPMGEMWDFHAGGGEFANIKLFTAALDARYGPSKTLEDFVWKSQAMSYDGQRAMFEAFGRNKYAATGVIQWMLNNAWPSVIWHLYDYYLRPAGGYYGTKKACEPLHVQYSYDDRSVVVVNDGQQAAQGLKVTAKVYDLNLGEKVAREEAAVNVPADGVARAFALPEVSGLTTTYFLRLGLEDASGKKISSNFYWLSTKNDVLDMKKSKWYYTPVQSHGDLTGLQQLPKVELKLSAECDTTAGPRSRCRVKVDNDTSHLAFLVRLKVVRERDHEEVLPVLWQDNYFELWPGESRQLEASFDAAGLGGAPALVQVDGWNVSARDATR
jgi:exo-1,4-beta-D-glucosaminidase